jgi:hypothetical protein
MLKCRCHGIAAARRISSVAKSDFNFGHEWPRIKEYDDGC